MESQEATLAVTTRSVGIRYGIFAAIVGILYFVIMVVAGIDLQGPARWLSALFTIALIFLAHKYYKENGDGFMDYGQGIGIAFWMGLVSAVISSIFTYIYVKFIDASFIEAMKTQQIEKFQESGMSDDQIDKAMEISGMFMTPEAMFAMGLVAGIIVTVVIALIVTIFTQKSRPEVI
jgi:hypothetical protein